MPIEFRCPGCSKLLRTPDESAGKKAKCPQCGMIADIPAAGSFADASPAAPQEPAPVPGPEMPPRMDETADYRRATDPVNPYASPAAVDEPFKADMTGGQLQHQQFGFDDTLSAAWEFFKQHLGNLAVFGVIIFAINAGLQIIGQIGGFAAQATQEPLVIVGFQLVMAPASFLLQTWVALATVLYMVKLLRTNNADLNELMAAGPFFLRGIGLNLLLALIFGGVLVLCMLPMAVTIPSEEPELIISAAVLGVLVYIPILIFLGLRYALCMFFLVDRQAGVVESLGLSAQYMRGNKGTAFMLFLVVGIVGGLFVCVTCTFGQILYIPFWGVLTTIIYLLATGQAFQRAGVAKTPFT
jgi:hypothetical protein